MQVEKICSLCVKQCEMLEIKVKNVIRKQNYKETSKKLRAVFCLFILSKLKGVTLS